ncbi:MAG: hypothetical protein JNL74_16690, partial [Fibrobacteres bacterium]|nr:hypothetical protein [Fibrobacterota bacterium]
SINFSWLGVAGFFDKTKFSLIILKSADNKSFMAVDTIENAQTSIQYAYGYSQQWNYLYQDNSSSRMKAYYKFRLIDKSSKIVGAESKVFTSITSDIMFINNNYIKDNGEYLECTYKLEDVKEPYRSNYKGEWVFLKRSIGEIDYIPFDTVLETKDRRVLTYRRPVGIYDFKIVNYFQNNLVLGELRLNTTSQYSMAPVVVACSYSDSGVSVQPILEPLFSNTFVLRPLTVLVWRLDKQGGGKSYVDSTIMSAKIYDKVPYSNKGVCYYYEAATRLPDGTLSEKVQSLDPVCIPKAMNYYPDVKIVKTKKTILEIVHTNQAEPFKTQSTYDYWASLKITRQLVGEGNVEHVVYNAKSEYGTNLLYDTVVNEGQYIYKAWYEYSAMDLCSDTMFTSININGRVSAPIISLATTEEPFPVVKFSSINNITSSLAMIRNFFSYTDTVIRSITDESNSYNVPKLVAYDTIREMIKDSLMYSFAFVSDGLLGDLSLPVVYHSSGKLIVPSFSVRSSADTASKIEVLVNNYSDSFRVFRALTVDGVYSKTMTAANRSSTGNFVIYDRNVSDYERYYYKIQSVCGKLESELSPAISVEIGARPLGATTLSFSGYDSGDTTYNKLTWTAVSGATSYEIYRDGIISQVVQGTVLTYIDIGCSMRVDRDGIFVPDTCLYKVRAKNQERNGLFSHEYEVFYRDFSYQPIVRLVK